MYSNVGSLLDVLVRIYVYSIGWRATEPHRRVAIPTAPSEKDSSE
jgi:hypothetical protein